MRPSYLVVMAMTACTLDAAASPPDPARDIQLASAGVVRVATDDGTPYTALHVRVAIANRGDLVPWTFDATAARLDGTSPAMLANADLATLPIAIVARGHRAVVDLYFEIANDARDFEVSVPVVVRGETVAKRARVTASDAAAGGALGTARVWWGAPGFAWSSYRHEDGIITPRPPTRATVTRSAR